MSFPKTDCDTVVSGFGPVMAALGGWDPWLVLPGDQSCGGDPRLELVPPSGGHAWTRRVHHERLAA